MKKQALVILFGFGLMVVACKQQGGSDRQVADLSRTTVSGLEAEKTNTDSPKKTEEIAPVSFDEEKARRILTGYFEKFTERNFTALKDYYAEEVKQFISLKNIKAEQVSKISSDFFKDKTNIYYTPDFSRFDQQAANGYFETTLPLEMTWSDNQGEEFRGTDNYYSRSTQVLLGITLDQSYKIVSYQEKKIIKPKYRLLQDMTAVEVEDSKTSLELSKGTIVTDFFEKKFESGLGSQIKVLYKGKAYWIPEYKEGFGRAGIRLIERVE
ncbi:MAG: hypothetical protein NW226_19525 [Microscillaceae bacterium]|nr:hypothetical protein [Microscillaceae bacterium]